MKPKSQSSNGRITWKYKEEAKRYHAANGYDPFTMVWNRTIDAEIRDASLPSEIRVLEAIRRLAWGHLSDWAVDEMPRKKATDPTPRALTQEQLGAMLGLSKSAMSKVCIFLKEAGYLRKDHQFLYPEKTVTPLDSVKDSGVGFYSVDSNSPYLRFEQEFFREHAELGTTLSDLEAQRNKAREQAKQTTTEILKLKRLALSKWRDLERTGEAKRYCACAQDEGEVKANCNPEHSFGVGSNSKMEWFPTPAPKILESGSNSTKKPNDSRQNGSGSLKPLKSIKEKGAAAADVTTESQSDRSAETPPPPYHTLPEPTDDPIPDPVYQNLVDQAAQYGIDEAGVLFLMGECQKLRLNCTWGEIAHFLGTEAERYRTRKTIKSLSGLLIRSVPQAIQGNLEKHRNAARLSKEAEKQEQIRIEDSWRERWEKASPEERLEIEELVPEIDFKGVLAGL